MRVIACTACGTELAPAEAPRCQGCSRRPSATIGDRALAVLEQADSPLSYWDIQRLMDRRHGRAPAAGSLLVYLSRDLRICWGGRGMYGLYRHGLIPNVRGLGPAAEAHLLAAPGPLAPEELHFVLQHQRYRYQYASLAAAMQRQLGHARECRRHSPMPSLSGGSIAWPNYSRSADGRLASSPTQPHSGTASRRRCRNEGGG